jgi:hypothetical protein
VDGAQEPMQDQVMEKYIAASKKFNNDYYEFLVKRWPDLKPILTIRLNYGLALLEFRHMCFYYLLQNAPERIVRDKGIDEFINFSWTAQDNEALQAVNPVFGELKSRILMMKQTIDHHPLLPQLQSKLKTLDQDKEFQALIQDFKKSKEKIAEMLTSHYFPR